MPVRVLLVLPVYAMTSISLTTIEPELGKLVASVSTIEEPRTDAPSLWAADDVVYGPIDFVVRSLTVLPVYVKISRPTVIVL